ncbi:MAG: hypothetical protein K0S37_2859 [Microbacterium sp.]|nr:hypothetical protein [Microbacterium sp.]
MSSTRYGVYLRPDPLTCWVQAQINLALKQQYGLVSAAAFPPHATLVGNLRTDATVDDLATRIGDAVASQNTFTVHNKGFERVGDAYLYNVHEDGRGNPNEPLVSLAAAVKAAVLPVSIPVNDYLVTPIENGTFKAHLSLASHDLSVDNTLADEVGEFLSGLPLQPPRTFRAEVVSLYETTSDDWNGHWWKTLRCTHLRSWKLPSTPRQAS